MIFLIRKKLRLSQGVSEVAEERNAKQEDEKLAKIQDIESESVDTDRDRCGALEVDGSAR